jgi:hypothetical protein
MANGTMKLITTESFAAMARQSGPDGAFAHSHTAPDFRRLRS